METKGIKIAKWIFDYLTPFWIGLLLLIHRGVWIFGVVFLWTVFVLLFNALIYAMDRPERDSLILGIFLSSFIIAIMLGTPEIFTYAGYIGMPVTMWIWIERRKNEVKR